MQALKSGVVWPSGATSRAIGWTSTVRQAIDSDLKFQISDCASPLSRSDKRQIARQDGLIAEAPTMSPFVDNSILHYKDGFLHVVNVFQGIA